MDALHRIADAKIREAIARGEFDDLPGKGKPLQLEDLSRVPEDLRGGYLLLKGAGVLPEEVELRKELLTLQDLLRACTDAGERDRLRRTVRERSLRLAILLDHRRRRIGRALPSWPPFQ